jgi:hypothetical protein
MSGAIPLLPLYAFLAWTGNTLPFTYNKTTLFPDMIFTKLKNAQQYYAQTSCTEFHPYRTIRVESMDRKTFMSLTKV